MAAARTLSRPASAALLPLDVRLMNGVSAAVFALAALVLLAAGLLWLARAPWFGIRVLQLEGELQRSNLPTLRANALPRLEGNFFSLDMARAQAAFEAAPWVRQATVRRVWPDRLAVRLEEHRPVALWQNDEENPRLVNDHGELFDANLGELGEQSLPVLDGPPGSAAAMWRMLQGLQPLLAPQDLALQRLTLSARGSWRGETAQGQAIEFGRGGTDEVLARAGRFARTLPQLAQRFGKPMLSADLRHAGGYAIRLQDVSTVATAASGSP